MGYLISYELEKDGDHHAAQAALLRAGMQTTLNGHRLPACTVYSHKAMPPNAVQELRRLLLAFNLTHVVVAAEPIDAWSTRLGSTPAGAMRLPKK